MDPALFTHRPRASVRRVHRKGISEASMRSRVQLAVCALVLLCGARSASGQAAGVVRGKVTDAATARPIAGAQVVLVGSASGARTDASGEYAITAVAAGARAVQVTHVGYTAALK